MVADQARWRAAKDCQLTKTLYNLTTKGHSMEINVRHVLTNFDGRAMSEPVEADPAFVALELAGGRGKLVYICAPYRGDVVENVNRVRDICRMFRHSCAFIAPHLFMSQIYDEEKDRERIMECCLMMIGAADALWIIGDNVTDGMILEIAHARKIGVPCRNLI